MKKNVINILIEGGLVQEVRADSLDIDVCVFDLDNEPDLEKEWKERTKKQKAYLYDVQVSAED